ncbi:hypothetical protein GW626_03230 [Peribacillus muralis]|uniref:hypothetical protein n=1 Tax=Peribacillus muralis TaxID=264697 RepID=UPI001F4D59EF|nr:hypothetical protein [Peribacillus muralis]MCK1993911.1 hypothetical protein [Peribacillus muralis]MCK2014466.1 hypothetical protein [Peribacillus muralis]
MTFLYVVFAAIFGAFLVTIVKRQSEPAKLERYQKQFRQLHKETLDVDASEIVADALIEKLNKALDYNYMERVNAEYRLKHPTGSQEKVNQVWRELKRYLIMAGVFGKVEMFNSAIDELWHIMLSHKQDYDQFCQTFIGMSILHHPHLQPVFKPEERTLFDFYYVQLFTVDSISIQTWGKFFKHDKGQTFLRDFETMELEQLKAKYMRKPTSKHAEMTFEHFTSQFKGNRPLAKMNGRKIYNQTDYAAPAYFTYASTDDIDKDFTDIFGKDHNSASTDSHHGGDHSSSHDSTSDSSSSCSSCSSCSS